MSRRDRRGSRRDRARRWLPSRGRHRLHRPSPPRRSAQRAPAVCRLRRQDLDGAYLRVLHLPDEVDRHVPVSNVEVEVAMDRLQHPAGLSEDVEVDGCLRPALKISVEHPQAGAVLVQLGEVQLGEGAVRHRHVEGEGRGSHGDDRAGRACLPTGSTPTDGSSGSSRWRRAGDRRERRLGEGEPTVGTRPPQAVTAEHALQARPPTVWDGPRR